MSIIKGLARIAIAFLLAFSIARAQSQFGSIAGHVTDESQAAVPGAAVRATNEATNVAATDVTGSAGDYVISGLLPGNYSVTVEKAGFNGFRVNGVVVIAAQTTGTDLSMKVGEAHETITVSASAAQLNTESGSVATSLPTQTIERPAILPQVTQSMAETVVPYLQGQEYLGYRVVAAYGSRSYDRRIDIDGVVYGLETTYPLREPPGSIDELQVTSVDADAEHQTSNTNEMTSTKGTNMIHGFIWDQIQNQALQSKYWYRSRSAVTAGTPTNTYGFSAGGPVYIPKLYNGRNKTFWNLSFDKQSLDQPGAYGDNIPSSIMFNGNFSQAATPIINPYTGAVFQGNMINIPESPIGKAILGLYQGPGLTYTTQQFVSDNAYSTYQYIIPFHTLFLRMDEQIGTKDNIHGLFAYNNQLVTQSNYGVPSQGLQDSVFESKYIAIAENHIFSPSMLNEVNFGWHQGNRFQYTNTTSGASLTTSLGLPQPLVAPPAAATTGGPIVSVTGIDGFNPEQSGAGVVDPHTVTFRDTFSWIHGRFTTKVGFELIRVTDTTTSYSNLFGTYSFTGQFTGNAIADLYLGLPSTTTRTEAPGPIGQAQKDFQYYVAVDAHFTKKLTMNFGVRVSDNTPLINPTGAYYNFNTANGELVVPNQASIGLLNPGLSPALLADVETAQTAGFPGQLVNSQHLVAPRLGFAYHLFDNTVVRGGFGVYGSLLNVGGATGGPFTPGVQNFTNVLTCATPGNCTPSFTLADPFPGSGVAAVSGLNVSGVNPRQRVPVMYQWNFTIEQELPGSFILRASYTGNEADQLPNQANFDLPPASTTPFSASRLVYPQWFSTLYSFGGGTSSYNALDVAITRRWKYGLTLDGGYSLQKCLTDSDEGGEEANYGTWGPLGITIEDPYNRDRDRGNCESIPRHKFRMMFTADVPIGKGRTLLGSPQGIARGALDKVVGGWSTSGFFIATSGHFYTPYWTGADPPNTSETLLRPDRVCSGKASPQTWDHMFDPTCFQLPPNGRYGNAGTGIINGLGEWRYDSSIFKDFSFSKDERMPKLRITMNALNLFNHPDKDIYSQTPFIINDSATVGRANAMTADSGLTGNLGTSRLIYFEARVLW